jgi:hypothetical protein
MLPLVCSSRLPITFGGSGSPAPSMTASASQPLAEIAEHPSASIQLSETDGGRASEVQHDLARANPVRNGDGGSHARHPWGVP